MVFSSFDSEKKWNMAGFEKFPNSSGKIVVVLRDPYDPYDPWTDYGMCCNFEQKIKSDEGVK